MRQALGGDGESCCIEYGLRKLMTGMSSISFLGEYIDRVVQKTTV